MKSPQEKVNQFINDNFLIDQFQIVEFTLLPAGKVLTDMNGETILIYYDLINDQVVYEFGEVKKKIKNIYGAGRKKTVDVKKIQEYKAAGETQQWIATEMGVSISTIKRNWKSGQD